MKRTVKMMVASLLFSSSAAFAAGGENTEGGILIYVFLGFGALIVAFQMVPGLILFSSMMKEFFSRPSKRADIATDSVNGGNSNI
jgi:hypothetical protein